MSIRVYEKVCANPYNGDKHPDTHYVVWYGDEQYYSTNSLADARQNFRALKSYLEKEKNSTPIYLVKTRLIQKVLSEYVLTEEEKPEVDYSKVLIL